MDAESVQQAVALLRGVEQSRTPIAPLTGFFPELGVEEAYAVQLATTELRLATGAEIVGHKVGLTSKAMQEMFHVDEPDFGVLFDDMFLSDGEFVSEDRFLQPRIEIEIAFRLASGLTGPDITLADALAATEAVAPAIEIIDSRIAEWAITLADSVADNASSGAVVLGSWVPIDQVNDLAAATATLALNGEEVAQGQGADVLGHPAAAVAWLANKLSSFGIELQAGHVVMPGSCTKAIVVNPGDLVTASIDSVGDVSVRFK